MYFECMCECLSESILYVCVWSVLFYMEGLGTTSPRNQTCVYARVYVCMYACMYACVGTLCPDIKIQLFEQYQRVYDGYISAYLCMCANKYLHVKYMCM
jgi:hypothetical protein